MCLMDWLIIGVIYILIGSLIASCFEFSRTTNPLLKIPICLLWPLVLIGGVCVLIVKNGLMPWIWSVIEYYEDKKEDRR